MELDDEAKAASDPLAALVQQGGAAQPMSMPASSAGVEA